ncbi:FAD dependent oxidoreductase superfamily [Leptospira ryugenii]|uniref:FAD dependent oxidoreductase superfamily n=1 Tax=Leptospira ryugenii TaxID=1917863 RepID=A0A2P2E1U7_9LEPT|nr:FAD dependent oxidoreductase superfamily [Leptospira ryugenii]
MIEKAYMENTKKNPNLGKEDPCRSQTNKIGKERTPRSRDQKYFTYSKRFGKRILLLLIK